MAGRGNPHIEFAGDYNLDFIVIHNHNESEAVDIKKLVVEFNLYESIYANAMTGSLVIADTTNLIGNLPVQGTERLTFRLATPGSPEIDCSDLTGHPMYVYAVSDKQQANDGMAVYTLQFASREFLRNIRTRVSKTFNSRIDQMVASIVADKDFLDSRKRLVVEKTRNQDKITMPNKHPFQAINMLQKRALADGRKGVGYHFYETPRGFHFRSWESMCVEKNGTPRKVKQTFEYMQLNTTDESAYDVKVGTNKVTHEYQAVETYRFIKSSHDTAMNQIAGTYAHRVISHNLYDKSYREDDYHYHNSYDDTKHTDDSSFLGGYPVTDHPVDFDNNGVSDYPESRVSVVPTTRFAHGEDTGAFGIGVELDGKTTAAGVSQANQVVGGTLLEMTIKGQSYLEVGDVIQFNLQSVENRNNTAGTFDPQYSGRYIITKIRHRVTDTDYVNVLECAKDSVANRYATSRYSGKIYKGPKRTKDKRTVVDIDNYTGV